MTLCFRAPLVRITYSAEVSIAFDDLYSLYYEQAWNLKSSNHGHQEQWSLKKADIMSSKGRRMQISRAVSLKESWLTSPSGFPNFPRAVAVT